MAADNGATPKIYFMPKNYGGFINIGGFPIRSRNILEAAIIGIFSIMGVYRGLSLIPRLLLQAKILITGLVGIPLIIISLLGIDGLSFTTWIANAVKYHTSNKISLFYKKIYATDVTYYINNEDADEGFDGSFFQEMVGKTKRKSSDRALLEFEKSLSALQNNESFELIYDPNEQDTRQPTVNMPTTTKKSHADIVKQKQQEKLEKKRRKLAMKQLKAEAKHHKKRR